jgi:hypothetical protein
MSIVAFPGQKSIPLILVHLLPILECVLGPITKHIIIQHVGLASLPSHN